jgi:hypothetical protein
MEKNLLPIGIANSRPNHDLNGYGSLDTLFSNVYFEVYQDAQTETQKVFCIKRPGISSFVSASYGSDDLGLGCFTAQPYTSTNIFFAKKGFGGLTYIQHFDGSSVVNVKVAGVSSKRVNFTNIGLPDDTYTTACVLADTLYLFKGRTANTTATPAGAGADLTRPIYLNNRVFIGDKNTGQIFQSNLGTYTTYGASEFISVESYGGKLVELARYNNYIVAFKEYSTEFFEDVANENGSVLGRVGQALQQIGTVHANTVVDTGSGELIWLSTDESGNHTIVKLSNSFQAEPIEDALVARTLNLISNYDGSYALFLNANGRQFYVLTLKQTYTDSTNASDVANVTFVYDLKTKIWTHWYTTGETGPQTIGLYTYGPLGRWNVTGACRNMFNTTYVQDYDNGNLYQLDDIYPNDRATSIRVVMRFGNLDLGTFRRKFLNKLTIFADGFSSTVSGWSSGQAFSVNLSRADGSQVSSDRSTTAYPHSLYALGAYKRFTLTIIHLNSTPMRVSAINLDYDIGESYGLS